MNKPFVIGKSFGCIRSALTVWISVNYCFVHPSSAAMYLYSLYWMWFIGRCAIFQTRVCRINTTKMASVQKRNLIMKKKRVKITVTPVDKKKHDGSIRHVQKRTKTPISAVDNCFEAEFTTNTLYPKFHFQLNFFKWLASPFFSLFVRFFFIDCGRFFFVTSFIFDVGFT